jgi:hypothetical protein
MKYLDQPRWFKRKKYGYGWTPCAWQGWAIVALYVFGLATLAVYVLPEDSASSPVQFIIATGIWTFLLLVITYRTGETPRWQWGNDEEDNT